MKELVRERDGACVKCGKTNAAHLAETGRQLDVHRRVPGSPYTAAGCVAVCRACHADDHRPDHAAPSRETPRVTFRLDGDTLADLDYIAARLAEQIGLVPNRTDAVRVSARREANRLRESG